MESWTTPDNKSSLIQLVALFDKSIKLYTKDNWFSSILSWILLIISFGQLKREKFLKNTATTIANLIFIPKEWSYSSAETVLIHEAQHVKQFRMFGLGIHPFLGLPLAALIYLFLPLPMFLAFGRLFLELQADKAQWKFDYQNYVYNRDKILQHAEYRAYSLSGPLYMWAVPYKIARYFYLREALKTVESRN